MKWNVVLDMNLPDKHPHVLLVETVRSRLRPGWPSVLLFFILKFYDSDCLVVVVHKLVCTAVFNIVLFCIALHLADAPIVD
jgi:hypothetical protein